MAANIMHLPLVTSTGKATSLAAFHGKILMISDVMTLCQETCPLDTANLVQTARELDKAGQRKNVEFLSITFDPARDTPAQLAAYRKLYAPPPANWTLLTGTPTDIATLWKYLGLWYQKVPQGKPPATNWRTGKPLTYDLNHADVLYFVDGTGHKRFDITGPADIPPGTRLPKTMRGYLDAEGVGALKHPNGDTWTPKQALDVLRWLLNHTTTTAADTGGAPD
ncbi:MAG: SCO family protein [Streptosporangiaceae bacterium]